MIYPVYSSNNISQKLVKFVNFIRLEKKFTVGIGVCHSVYFLFLSDVTCEISRRKMFTYNMHSFHYI